LLSVAFASLVAFSKSSFAFSTCFLTVFNYPSIVFLNSSSNLDLIELMIPLTTAVPILAPSPISNPFGPAA
jgi:hypothetical protein